MRNTKHRVIRGQTKQSVWNQIQDHLEWPIREYAKDCLVHEISAVVWSNVRWSIFEELHDMSRWSLND